MTEGTTVTCSYWRHVSGSSVNSSPTLATWCLEEEVCAKRRYHLGSDADTVAPSSPAPGPLFTEFSQKVQIQLNQWTWPFVYQDALVEGLCHRDQWWDVLFPQKPLLWPAAAGHHPHTFAPGPISTLASLSLLSNAALCSESKESGWADVFLLFAVSEAELSRLWWAPCGQSCQQLWGRASLGTFQLPLAEGHAKAGERNMPRRAECPSALCSGWNSHVGLRLGWKAFAPPVRGRNLLR